MKRRVAGLPPVTADIFNQKVSERQSQNLAAENAKASTCDICEKTYTTDNAFKSHLNSKKHRENELKAAKKLSLQSLEQPALSPVEPTEKGVASALKPVSLTVESDATEEDVNKAIDEKIAAASEQQLSLTQCLFCPHPSSSSLEANLEHMAIAHSFFLPDAEYLDDLAGLITYLGEKLAIGNACLYCSNSGREFRDLAAVRKHMADKGHCKIAYDTEDERLEISDFYDFTTSYPAAQRDRKARRRAQNGENPATEEDEEWEDDAGEGDDVDEVVDILDEDDSDLDDLPDNGISYGDTPYELILPTGVRVGHRKVRGLHPSSQIVLRKGKPEDPESAAALVKKYNLDKKSGIIPRKGGFGAFGQGLEVIKARNAGEAREAGRHIREFRDIQRKEQFKTKVGFIHNNQKHFRDPLLQ